MKLEEKERILIVGAGSKTATAIKDVLKAETPYELFFIEHVPVPDFTEEVTIASFTNRREIRDVCLRIRPTVIVNTAAYTNVDKCEHEKQEAWVVNVKGVENLVQMSRLVDAHLIHFSTDYIFDGTKGPYTEEDKPHPLGYYGKTKLASENVCKGGSIPYTIIRTNVLYGSTGARHQDFVTWLLGKLEKEEPIKVVNDQFSNPTLVDDLGIAVERIIKRKRYGIYNIAGATWLNRWEFAQRIAEYFGFNKDIIQPITTEELGQSAHRPKYGGLVTLKAETDLRMKMSSVENGLSMIKQRVLREARERRA